MYQIRILDAAARDLARLDPAIGRRIVSRMRWLAGNLNDVKLEALTVISLDSISFESAIIAWCTRFCTQSG